MSARGRWVGGIGTALVVLLIAGAWQWPQLLRPSFLDANQHRDVLETLAARALGRAVRIEGTVAFDLLPQPSLVAAKVTVGDREADGVRITARELRLRVGLWPLLAGRLDARDLVLVGADITLPWPAGGLADIRPPDWLSGVAARIENSIVRLGNQVATEVNLQVIADPYTGSTSLAGSARLPSEAKLVGGTSPRDIKFSARLSARGADGSVGLELAVDGQGALLGSAATLSGQLAADGTGTGQVSVRSTDLGQLLPAPKLPFRLEGRVTLAQGLAALDGLAGELAGSPLRGAVSLRLQPQPRLDVALAVTRLDLDLWSKFLPAIAGPARPGAGRPGPERTGTLGFGLDLSAEAATYAGGLVRQLRVAIDVGEDGVTLREGRAVLPGEALLALSGKILPENPDFLDSPRFSGAIKLDAADLRGSLGWAAGLGLAVVEHVPPQVLRSVNLAGDIELAPARASLARLAGTLDGAKLTGDLTLRLGARPAIAARIAMDRLALDPWVAGWWDGAMPDLVALALAGPGLDLDLSVNAGAATLRGLTLSAFGMDVMRGPGRLSVPRLAFRSEGVDVLGTGALLDGKRLADVRLDVRAAELGAIAARLPDLPAIARALLRGAGSATLTASGGIDALGARLVADLGDLHVEAQPTLNLLAGSWATRLAIRHPGAPRLLEQLGFKPVGQWLGDGSFSLALQLSGSEGKLASEHLDLGAGDLRAGGSLAATFGEVPTLTGRIAFETLPWPTLAPRSTTPLALAALGNWQADLALSAAQIGLGDGGMDRAAGRLTLADGRLALQGFSADLAGGRLTGNAAMATRNEPPALTIEAAIAGVSLPQPLSGAPVDVTAALVDGRLALTASGHAPAALLGSLSGTVDLVLRDGALNGVALAGLPEDLPEAAVRAALTGGNTGFARVALTIRIDHGVAILAQAELLAPSGRGTASGQLDLVTGRLDIRLALRPEVPDAPELGLRVTGLPGQMVATPELAALTRWRAAH